MHEIISQSRHIYQKNWEKILSVKADKDLKRPNAPVKTRNGHRSLLCSDKHVDSFYYLVLAQDTFKALSCMHFMLLICCEGFKAPLIDLRNCGRFKIAVNKSSTYRL